MLKHTEALAAPGPMTPLWGHQHRDQGQGCKRPHSCPNKECNMQSCHYRPQAKYTHCAQSALRGCLLLMARGALEGPFYVTTIFALPPTLVVDLQRVRCHSQTTHTHTQAHTTSICPSIRVSIQQKHRPIRPMCHCASPPSHLPDNVCVSRTTARATVRPANHLTALPSMHMQNTARCTQFTRTHGVAHPSGL